MPGKPTAKKVKKTRIIKIIQHLMKHIQEEILNM